MPQTESQSSYGLVVGFIYIFNLIVGTGALTMPKAFENSGIILSAALLVFLTFMSFITATFMFEAMSITNAIKKLQKLQSEETRGQNANANSYANPNFAGEESERSTIVSRETTVDVSKSINDALGGVVEDDNDTSEQRPLIDSSSSSNKPLNSSRTPLPASLAPRPLQQFYYRRILSYIYDARSDVLYKQKGRADGDLGPVSDPASIDYLFNINYKFEMGEMAGIYFSRIGKLFFYLAMILYLYGDLAIYDAAVPKSLRDTTCTYKPENTTVSPTDEDICWPSIPGLTRLNAYRIYVLLFNMTIGVLVFYNVQKTKLLQMLTTVMRWAAFIAMIALAVKKIHENSQDPSQKVTIKLADIESVPNFFGVCIYAFMCHHSLPSIITPMRRKENYKRIFITTYSCIMVFYLLLSSTAVFAFGNKLDDFYTLNFAPSTYDKSRDSVFILVVDYYLALFPVFTISASFPIIGITLRNNLKSLYYFIRNLEDDLPGQPLPSNQKSYFISLALPLITLTPPLIISLITHDLQLLVGFTGSYAGVAIQYVIPSCLVYFGRKEAVRVFRENFQLKHSYASPFKSKFWVFFVLLWANISIIFVTIDHIIKFYNN